MLQHSTYIEIDLERGEAVSLLRAQGCVLRCLHGTLWLTEDNGGGDVVLRAGNHHALTRRGRCVVQSVGGHPAACRLTLARSPRSVLGALCARLAAPVLAAAWPRVSAQGDAG